jgi:eukaryotic-like serine/threonine-protein kinase
LLRDVLDRVDAAAASRHMISPDVAAVIEAALVRLYLASGEDERALQCSERALESLGEVGPESARTAAGLWADRAVAHARRGEFARSIEAAERARGIDSSQLLTYSESVHVQFSSARALWDAGRSEDAIVTMFEARALALLSRGDHPDNYDVVGGSLASLLLEVGRVDEAIPLALEAARNESERHGAMHRHAIEPRATIGNACLALGAPHAALAVLDEALEAASAVEGPQDPRTLRIQDNRANALRAIGCPLDALREKLAVLELRRATLGQAHVQVAASVRAVADLLLELGRPAEALREVQQGLAGLDGILSDSDGRVAALRATQVLARARAEGRRLGAADAAVLADELALVRAWLGPFSKPAREIEGWIEEAQGSRASSH